MNKELPHNFRFPSFEEHEIFIAKNTTPSDRFNWLVETWEALKDYLPRRDLLTEEEKRIWFK